MNPPAEKTYTIELLVDGHLTERSEVSAPNVREAICKAIDARRATAIRERRPEIAIDVTAARAA